MLPGSSTTPVTLCDLYILHSFTNLPTETILEYL